MEKPKLTTDNAIDFFSYEMWGQTFEWKGWIKPVNQAPDTEYDTYLI